MFGINQESTQTENKFPALTTMGAVRLRVKNMNAVYDFYTKGVGLDEINSSNGEVMLGLADHDEQGNPVERVILILEHDPELRHPSRTDAGLFHTAVLFPTKAELSKSLVSTLNKYQELYTGAGEHLVSQAFYFADPEGNGVELYWDRPREEWTWSNGEVRMDTLYIDPIQFIRENLTEEEIVKAATSTDPLGLTGTIGHVHLQVGDTAVAQDFYVKALGFDRTLGMGNQALFVSAGGYHHHMAMNIWNSRGAGPRDKTLGLGIVNLQLPGQESIAQAADRLKFHGIKSEFDGNALRVNDPWNNTLILNPTA